MIWAGNVACMRKKCLQGFGGGNLEGRDRFEDTGVGWKIILKWILLKWSGGL